MRLNVSSTEYPSPTERERERKEDDNLKREKKGRIKMAEGNTKRRKRKEKKRDTPREIKIRKKWTTKRAATGRHCWNDGHPMARTSRG